MAYNFPRNRPATPPEAPETPQFPGPVDIWDTISAPMAGLWEGLVGKNRNFKQYMLDKARKRRGKPPGQYPGRGPVNWLGRTITGK